MLSQLPPPPTHPDSGNAGAEVPALGESRTSRAGTGAPRCLPGVGVGGRACARSQRQRRLLREAPCYPSARRRSRFPPLRRLCRFPAAPRQGSRGASSLRLQSPGGRGGPRPVPAPGTCQMPGRVSETLPRGLCRAPTARHAGRGRGPRRNPPDAGPCPPQGMSRPRAFRTLSSVQVRAPQPDTRGRASSCEQSHLPSGVS